MNREKKNKIPSMQVGFIDAVCLQLYEVWWVPKKELQVSKTRTAHCSL